MGFDLGSNNSQRRWTRSRYITSGTRCPQTAAIGDASFTTIICQAPGSNPISQETKERMSQADAMTVAGGIGALPKIDGKAHDILCELDARFRGCVLGEDSDLGFVQMMKMEGGTVVEPHHDGVNDGDLVLVVAAQGVAQCMIEGESFIMNPMDVYALRPGEQLHSVRALPGPPRYVFTLRYFSLGNSNPDVSNLHLWRTSKGDSTAEVMIEEPLTQEGAESSRDDLIGRQLVNRWAGFGEYAGEVVNRVPNYDVLKPRYHVRFTYSTEPLVIPKHTIERGIGQWDGLTQDERIELLARDSHTDDGTNGKNASLGGPLSEDDNGLSKRPRLCASEVRFAHSALF